MIPVFAALALVLMLARFVAGVAIFAGWASPVLMPVVVVSDMIAFAGLALAFRPSYERSEPQTGRIATALVVLSVPLVLATVVADALPGRLGLIVLVIELSPTLSLGVGLSLGAWIADRHDLLPRRVAMGGQLGGAGLVLVALGGILGAAVGMFGLQVELIGQGLSLCLLYYLFGLARLHGTEPWVSRWSAQAAA